MLTQGGLEGQPTALLPRVGLAEKAEKALCAAHAL